MFFLGLFALLVALQFYVARRIWQIIRPLAPRAPYALFAALLVLLAGAALAGISKTSLPFSADVQDVFGAISSYFMGIALYTILAFALLDLGILIVRLVNRKLPRPLPDKTRAAANACALAVAVLVFGYGAFHATQIELATYDVVLDQKIAVAGNADVASASSAGGAVGSGAAESQPSRTLTVALISDVHLGAQGSVDRLEKAVAQINELDADVVCIAGDFFNTTFDEVRDPEAMIELVQTIQSRYGVYACMGNHDAGFTTPKMLEFMERAGVTMLNDEAAVVDGRFVLVGRLDGRSIGRYTATNGAPLMRGDLATAVEGIDPATLAALPVIVLDHNPANITQYEPSVTDVPVDLIFCGHTHHGQLFPGNLITGSMYAVDYGYYRASATSPQVIVTSGVGLWGPPVRVGSDSEVACVRISY